MSPSLANCVAMLPDSVILNEVKDLLYVFDPLEQKKQILRREFILSIAEGLLRMTLRKALSSAADLLHLSKENTNYTKKESNEESFAPCVLRVLRGEYLF